MSLAVERLRGLLEPDPGLYDGGVSERVEEVESRLGSVEERLEQLESEIAGFGAALALYESRLKGLEVFRAAASMLGAWKASTCRFQEDGVCRLWRINGEAAEKLADILVEDGGVARVNVAKAPWFCALCPLYQQARDRA